MDWGYLFTSFDGRINRGKYWAGVVVLYLIIVVAVFILAAILGDSASFWVLYFIAAAAYFVSSLAIMVKRWHDRGKSGWWVLILLIPLVGPIWALVELGFLEGTPGDNQYGPNPLAT